MCEKERISSWNNQNNWLHDSVEKQLWVVKWKAKKIVDFWNWCVRISNPGKTYSLLINWEKHSINWETIFLWIDRVKIVNEKVFWIVKIDSEKKFSLFIWNNIIEINWEISFDKIPRLIYEKWKLIWRVENQWKTETFSIDLV